MPTMSQTKTQRAFIKIIYEGKQYCWYTTDHCIFELVSLGFENRVLEVPHPTYEGKRIRNTSAINTACPCSEYLT